MENETNVNQNMLVFQERLKALRGNNKLQDVAKEIGISRASLGYYENGDRKPDIESLLKLANYYHVSCDYLLGVTNVASPDINIREISEQTGLNEKAISTLFKHQHNAIRVPEDAYDDEPIQCQIYLNTLNKILQPTSNILTNISNYLYLNFDCFYDDDTYSDEDLYRHISELGLFDKRLGVAYSEDFDYLSQVFLLMVQKELIQLREEAQQCLPERTTPKAENDFGDYEDDDDYLEDDDYMEDD